MAEPARNRAIYDDLYTIPENMTGEIIDGDLIVTPRPRRTHVHTASILSSELIQPFYFGRGGGPGGWIIYTEPEIELGEHVLVPDLAGWRKERLSILSESASISVPPDWICEIPSPSTARTDKVRKMPIYGEFGVSHIWLVDPLAKTLDAFRLESGKWLLVGSFAEDDKVRVEPFHEVEIELGSLWLE